jgi:hypothetical protein
VEMIKIKESIAHRLNKLKNKYKKAIENSVKVRESNLENGPLISNKISSIIHVLLAAKSIKTNKDKRPDHTITFLFILQT